MNETNETNERRSDVTTTERYASDGDLLNLSFPPLVVDVDRVVRETRKKSASSSSIMSEPTPMNNDDFKCELLYCGATDHGAIGRVTKSPDAAYPDLNEPTKFASLESKTWRAIGAGSAAAHCAAIDSDGVLHVWGRNERGQCGTNDYVNRGTPTVVQGLKDVKCVAVACGRSHTVVVAENGDVYGFGSNKFGQLGCGAVKQQKKKGDSEDDRLTPVKALVTNGAAVSCGADFTAVLTRDGEVFTFGMPQYGQLGHGTDHEYNKSASSIKIVYEPQPHPRRVTANGFGERKIVKVRCGHNHTVCFDDAGKIWTWGNGGYGRLGHKVQQDEFAPKMVEIQGGDRNLVPKDAVIGAGSVSSFVSAVQGQLYAFGKLKTAGDNTMYPTPFLGLSGWVLRDFACGHVTYAACAEKSAVTWGGGLYGELGYGPSGKKSSAQPDLVPSLEGKTTHRVAAGNGFTLFLVEKEDAKDLPSFTPGPDVETKPEPKAPPAKKAKKK